MAKTIKMCDMSGEVAAKVFQMLNGKKVKLESTPYWWCKFNIITDVEPKDLTYPEGWYYAKGSFRNKHMSTTGAYHEIPMWKSDKTPWETIAHYSTLED